MVDYKRTCKHCNGTNNVTKCEVSERCDALFFCDECMKPCKICSKRVCVECGVTCEGCDSLVCYDTCSNYCETCSYNFCDTHMTSDKGTKSVMTDDGVPKCGTCVDNDR